MRPRRYAYRKHGSVTRSGPSDSHDPRASNGVRAADGRGGPSSSSTGRPPTRRSDFGTPRPLATTAALKCGTAHGYRRTEPSHVIAGRVSHGPGEARSPEVSTICAPIAPRGVERDVPRETSAYRRPSERDSRVVRARLLPHASSKRGQPRTTAMAARRGRAGGGADADGGRWTASSSDHRGTRSTTARPGSDGSTVLAARCFT